MQYKIKQTPITGRLMILIGMLVIAPIVIIPWFPEDIPNIKYFLIPGGLSIIIGLIVNYFSAKCNHEYSFKDSLGHTSLTVLFAWGWGVLVGAMPFILSKQLTIVQSLFEAVSGWTTTGLSTLVVTDTTAIYLFHRSFMQYCGGLGFIMVMILFISNKSAMKLYSAEGHPDKIMPNIKKTAQVILIIYNICLVLGTIAYRLADMPWFDGICHTMCALSTGGFSTKLNSIGEYDSLSIEMITIVLMLIGTTNFAALILLAKGKLKRFFSVSEVRFMFAILIIFIPPTAISLAQGLDISFAEGLRKASFDIVSAMSTSGYSTMSYAQWPHFAIGVLILMMIMGGGIGSTAGGIKLTRVYLSLKVALANLIKRLSPARNVSVPRYTKADGKTEIDDELTNDTFGFVIAYLIVFVIGSLCLTWAADCTLTEAMFDFSSSLSTVGLSIGITNPTTSNLALIIEMIGMLLGRLEIFIVLIGITYGFSKFKLLFRRK